jgi:cytosine/adenosine deaminase-related metal-dependent hydrolase
MLHHLGELEKLANLLIKGITSVPAKIFNLNSGEIAVGKDADFALIKLPDEIKKRESIALQTILHTNKVDVVYIDGKKIS